MVVTQTVAAPPQRVWDLFTDVRARPAWLPDVAQVRVLSQEGADVRWHETRHARSARDRSGVTEELRLTVAEPGRRCVLALAGGTGTIEREYVFDHVEVGPLRGGTVVTVVDVTPPLPGRLLDLVVGGFAARTVEGAVRDELDALAGACVTRVMVAA